MTDTKRVVEIILSVLFICASVLFVSKMTSKLDTQQNLLMRFVMFLFTAIVALFITDKTVTIGTPLLTDRQSEEILELIKTMTTIIFAFYFGTQSSKNDKS